jgi:hypothetical protein
MTFGVITTSTNAGPAVTSSSTETYTPETSGGYSTGQSTTDLVTFYGGTPIVQPAATAQSAVATTAITTVVTTASVQSSGFGYTTSTQAEAIVAAVNSLVSRTAANTTLLNAIRTALTGTTGLNLIKGSA